MNSIAYENRTIWRKDVMSDGGYTGLDGLVNEAYFSRSDRILYLLRDLHGFSETKNDGEDIRLGRLDDFDLKMLSDTETDWKEMCCWAVAYKDPNVSYMKAEQYSGALLEVAILNLRKYTGSKNRTVDQSIFYEQMLRQLIRKLSPKLVLCCGTFEQAKKIYKTRSTSNRILMLETGTRCFFADQSLFIDFVHPGVKICKAATYSYAKDVFKEINNFLRSK